LKGDFSLSLKVIIAMGLVRGLSIHHQRDPVVTWFQPNNDDENRPTMAELADFIVKKNDDDYRA